MKLTKAIIEGAELPKKGQVFLWDAETKGFGVRFSPGGAITFIAQARVKGITRRVSLGRYGANTVQQARKKAKAELARMSNGIDPVQEKAKQEMFKKTLREITEAYFVDRKDMKRTSREDIHRHIKTSFADWADKPAVNITRDKVYARFNELSEKSYAQANQAFRVLRAILNYAKGEYTPDGDPLFIINPVSVLSDKGAWNPVKARSNKIPVPDIKERGGKVGEVWNLLRSTRNNPYELTITHTGADALCFLLLTGCRWSEMATLTWNNVNIDEQWWYIPDPKNRNPVTFPLSDTCTEILKERAKEKKSEFVFPGRSGSSYIKYTGSLIDEISKITGKRTTAHDLRRTFRAIALECNIELWKTKLLMNHSVKQDVTICNYTETSDLRYLQPQIEMIATWITRQAAIAKSQKVVPFPSRRVKNA